LVARLTPMQRASQLVSSQAPAISAGANPLLRPVFAGQTTFAAPANAGDTNGDDGVPQVSATAQTGNVAITQASSVPGVATITATGPDGIVTTYKINFARQPSGDEFNSSTFGSQLQWVRESAADWSLSSNPHSLTITPKTGDLITTTNTAQNLLLQPA